MLDSGMAENLKIAILHENSNSSMEDVLQTLNALIGVVTAVAPSALYVMSVLHSSNATMKLVSFMLQFKWISVIAKLKKFMLYLRK